MRGILLAAAASAALAAGLWPLTDAPLAATVAGDPWQLLRPRALLALAAGPWLVWMATRSLADLPRGQLVASTAARLALLGALALTLASPVRTTERDDVSVVALVDVSESVTDAGLAAAQDRIAALWAARRPGDDMAVVTFADDARLVAPEGEGPPPIARHDDEDAPGTDPSAALRLALGLFADGKLRRAVLLSDGGQTRGDLLAEAARAAGFGARLYAYADRSGTPPEVAVTGVVLPDRIRVGEPFEVRVDVVATRAGDARLRLYQGPVLNGLDGIRDLALEAGPTTVTFRSIVRVPGPITYRARIETEGEDRFPANDAMQATAVVPGRPAVLYVEGDPGRGTHLASALSAADFEVEVRGPAGMPSSLRELDRFDFLVLSDVPADRVSLTEMQVVERWVRDVGGGFLMAGGSRSFGLGGWQGTRMERILPVRLDSERRRDQPSLALSLVIDKSGSMNGRKIELAKEAAKSTAAMLGAEDYIGVVGFDSRPSQVVRMQSARNRLAILQGIGRLAARGGTAIFPALDTAFQELAVTRAQVKHVILLTDGQAPETGIPDLTRAMRAEGITVSTVGLGADVNRSLLTSVAGLGGGRSYFTNDPHNIPRIFMRETSTVARSAAVEDYVAVRVVSPAAFLRGVNVASAPYLRGYVATRRKPRPAQVVLESELGEPLLARWRLGLGWSLAWTSDVKARWSADWIRWPGFSRFWAQLVREHMRQRRRATLPMTATVEDGEVRVVVDAIGEDDGFVDGLDSEVQLTGPMGGGDAEEVEVEAPLRQTAPGRYEARLPLDAYGSFLVTARHERDGRVVAESFAEASYPYPREYARFAPDEALLARAAALTGGALDPAPAAVFDAGDASIAGVEHHWPDLALVALCLWLVDLLLRRLRWPDGVRRA